MRNPWSPCQGVPNVACPIQERTLPPVTNIVISMSNSITSYVVPMWVIFFTHVTKLHVVCRFQEIAELICPGSRTPSLKLFHPMGVW